MSGDVSCPACGANLLGDFVPSGKWDFCGYCGRPREYARPIPRSRPEPRVHIDQSAVGVKINRGRFGYGYQVLRFGIGSNGDGWGISSRQFRTRDTTAGIQPITGTS